MASLIPGYEYDIFISYRQKDNKHDGWVTKFVDNLKGELEATFKEDISVYFDENPHDRLQETHNVDKTLEGKLKCLIFIPILSQTYCDPNSYAWQYEFLAFLRMAEKDHLGKDVRLRSGNVASRILPIRIHDLEQEDITLFEKETGSVLRALDFVFKTSTGVSRPLKATEDHPQDNLNKTFYSDQINKVGHSVKEIILAMKKEPEKVVKEKERAKEVQRDEGIVFPESSPKPGKLKFVPFVAIVAVLVIIAILVYPKIFKRDTLEKMRSSGERISVAVMPFINMTGDSSWNKWQESIQMNLTSSISNSKELLVRQTELINRIIQNNSNNNYAAFTPSIANTVSQKLDANVFIYGNISKAGKILRIDAQLINTETKNILKSFPVETSFVEDSIFKLINTLSTQVNDYLVLSILKKKDRPDFRNFESTNSPTAYLKYMQGWESFGKSDFISSRNFLLEAIKIDSNFTLAEILLSLVDLNLYNYSEGREYCSKVYGKRDKLSDYLRLKIEDINAWYTEGPGQRIKFLKQLIELDDQNPSYYSSLGNAYRLTAQHENAIPQFEMGIELNEKLDLKPFAHYYYSLGECLHKTGQYNKESRLYEKAETNYPDNSTILSRQIILSLSEKDTSEANKLIEKYIYILKGNYASEATISLNLATIYEETDMLDKSEQYYRKACELNQAYTFRLSNFLIEKDRGINEGLELAVKKLELYPESYNNLHAKGWGLYKQGKFKEALDILQNSWDLRMKNAIYDHEAFLHLEAAKKAVAGMKSN